MDTPAAKFDTSCVFAPLFHKYVYGAVPPVAVKSIDPVETPLHVKSTCVVVNTIGEGCVTVIVALAEH